MMWRCKDTEITMLCDVDFSRLKKGEIINVVFIGHHMRDGVVKKNFMVDESHNISVYMVIYPKNPYETIYDLSYQMSGPYRDCVTTCSYRMPKPAQAITFRKMDQHS